MIEITIPNLPDQETYLKHIRDVFKSKTLTNNGPKLRELEQKLSEYSGCMHVIPMSNGTVTLYCLLKTIEDKGDVITTPFTYIATANAIKESGHDIVFCDIGENTTNMSPEGAEKLIDDNTKAIIPVHCYGNPCDVIGFEKLSKKYNLPIIYDAAHAFNGSVQGKSILSFGLASSVSFHATKVFNCVEGGAVFTNDGELAAKLRAFTKFGLNDEGDFVGNSLNFKLSEVHAAMGLALFDRVELDWKTRFDLYSAYQRYLPDHMQIQLYSADKNHTMSYMPVVSQKYNVDELVALLARKKIKTRRYFNPSLDQYFGKNKTKPIKLPNSYQLASKVLCLPFHHLLSEKQIKFICRSCI